MKKKAHSVTKNSASFLQFLLSYSLLQANLNYAQTQLTVENRYLNENRSVYDSNT